jgi:hypothetical protein
MKLKIKKIEPLRAGYILGVVYALLSLFVIVPITLISQIFNPNSMGIIMVIILPIIYGYWIFRWINMSALYNLVSKWIGGLKLKPKKSRIYRKII